MNRPMLSLVACLLLATEAQTQPPTPAATQVPVTEPKGVEPASESGRLQVAKRLRSGFIAYGVDLPKENTVGAILGLNDYVVVLFTLSADSDKKTVILMKNIRVIAAPAGTVLLEVTTEEAKLLKTAQESGTLALGLIAEADLKDEKALQDRKGEMSRK